MAYQSDKNNSTEVKDKNLTPSEQHGWETVSSALPNSLMADIAFMPPPGLPNSVMRESLDPKLSAAEAEADFSPNFHGHPESARKNASINARAHTQRSDVWFGSVGFEPSAAAHELVHTVQQRAVSGNVSQNVSAGTVQRESFFKKLRRRFRKNKNDEAASAEGIKPDELDDDFVQIQGNEGSESAEDEGIRPDELDDDDFVQIQGNEGSGSAEGEGIKPDELDDDFIQIQGNEEEQLPDTTANVVNQNQSDASDPTAATTDTKAVNGQPRNEGESVPEMPEYTEEDKKRIFGNGKRKTRISLIHRGWIKEKIPTMAKIYLQDHGNEFEKGSVSEEMEAVDKGLEQAQQNVENAMGSSALDGSEGDVPGDAAEVSAGDVPGNAAEVSEGDVPGNAAEVSEGDVPGDAPKDSEEDVSKKVKKALEEAVLKNAAIKKPDKEEPDSSVVQRSLSDDIKGLFPDPVQQKAIVENVVKTVIKMGTTIVTGLEKAMPYFSAVGQVGGLAANIKGIYDGINAFEHNRENIEKGADPMEAVESLIDTISSAIASYSNLAFGLPQAAADLVPSTAEGMAADFADAFNSATGGAADAISVLGIITGSMNAISGTMQTVRNAKGWKKLNNADKQLDEIADENDQGSDADGRNRSKGYMKDIIRHGRNVKIRETFSGAAKALSGISNAAGSALTLTGVGAAAGGALKITSTILNLARTGFEFGMKYSLRKKVVAEDLHIKWGEEMEKVRAMAEKYNPNLGLKDKEVRAIILLAHGSKQNTRTAAFNEIKLRRARYLLNVARRPGPYHNVAELVIEGMGVHKRGGRFAVGAEELLAEKLT